MRILFLIDSLEIGGVQRQLLEVCRALVRRGDSVTLVAFRSDDRTMARAFDEAGVRVQFLTKATRFDLNFALRLRSILARAWDVTHAMTPQTALWVALLRPSMARGAFLGSVLNTHRLHEPKSLLAEKWITSPRLDGVLVNSKAGAVQYRRLVGRAQGVVTITNGVAAPTPQEPRESLRSRFGLKPRDFAIVCIGRLVPVKRHGDAIAALAKLHRFGVSAKLVLIGDGPLHRELAVRARSLHVADHVVFAGELAEPSEVLHAFDAFLMPSASEGLPNALLEAMAAGLPCVATRVGGIPEVVRDGRDGFLVAAGNVNEMAAALLRTRSAGEVGVRGRARVVARFSMERMIEQTLAWYDEAAAATFTPLAYVASQFPKLSEAFVLREVLEIVASGIGCSVFTFKPSREATQHADALALRSRIVERPWLSERVLADSLRLFLRSPVRYVHTLVWLAMLHVGKPRELAKALAASPKVASFALECRRRGVRHIHAHWANLPTALAWAMARLAGATFSFTAHAHDIYRNHHALPEKLVGARFVATCTGRNKAHLDRLVAPRHRSKIHLVRHFLNTMPARHGGHRSGSGTTILSVGTLMYYKGFDLLIRAVALLSHRGHDVRLRIVGGGDQKVELETLAERLEITDRVTLLGPLPQEGVFAELAKADIFCLASRKTSSGSEDNLPNVLVEAALAHVPIVTTRVGSIPELLPDADHGLVVEPGSPRIIADAIESTISYPAAARRRVEVAARRAEDLFSRHANSAILLAEFRSALGVRQVSHT